MFTKMKNKMNNMTTKDWIAFSLWMVTFVLLIAFVISAATVSKGTEVIATTTPKFVTHGATAPADLHNFGIDAKTSLYVNGSAWAAGPTDDVTLALYAQKTADVDFVAATHTLQLVEGTTTTTVKLWTTSATLNVSTLTDTDSYANVLASLGAAFGLLLIGSMFTTVYFAWDKKRGGNK